MDGVGLGAPGPLLTAANGFSILRILLIPCLVASLVYYEPERGTLRWLALGLFGLAMLTDAIDGALARATRQRTTLGALLDPLADKLLLVVMFLCLALLDSIPRAYRIPPWVVITVISRDLILLLGTVLVYLVTNTLEVRPSWLGKFTTGAQMITVVAVLLHAPWAPWAWRTAVAFTAASGVHYLWAGTRRLNAPRVTAHGPG